MFSFPYEKLRHAPNHFELRELKNGKVFTKTFDHGKDHYQSNYIELRAMFGRTDYSSIMVLKLFVDPNHPELLKKYLEAAKIHNDKLKNDEFLDAGFDLFTPSLLNDEETEGQIDFYKLSNKIDFKVKMAAEKFTLTTYNNDRKYERCPTGFYLYPRSSLGKTALRLSNSVGIIDSGYRGSIIGLFDLIGEQEHFQVKQFDRLVQICAPDLCPIVVDIVSEEKDLGILTERGKGGFGSTNESFLKTIT